MPLSIALTSEPRNPATRPFTPPVNYGATSVGDGRQYRVPEREPSPAFDPHRGSPTYLQVLGYFQAHLTATTKDAMTALRLSRATVQRHVKLIRQDWERPAAFIMDPEAIEMRLRNLERAISRGLAPA